MWQDLKWADRDGKPPGVLKLKHESNILFATYNKLVIAIIATNCYILLINLKMWNDTLKIEFVFTRVNATHVIWNI